MVEMLREMLEIVCENNSKENINSVELKFVKLNR